VLSNQDLLVDEFARVRETATHPILFDGHNLIDAGGHLIEIPLEVIASLKHNSIVFIHLDANMICQRKSLDVSRERPIRDAVTLEQHQQHGISLGRAHAEALGIPFTVVEAGDELAFSQAMDASLQQ
jgi:adenylate kinase